VNATPVPLPVHYHIRYGTPLHFDGDADAPRDVAAAAEHARVELTHLLRDTRNARRGLFR
jgi:hypothetical protein